MSAETVLAAVVDLLERMGWASSGAIGRDRCDLIGAFEQVSGLALRGVPASVDGSPGLARHPDCDQALRTLAQVIATDRGEAPPLDDTDDAVAAIAAFNDQPDQTWAVVRRTLHEARELSRTER